MSSFGLRFHDSHKDNFAGGSVRLNEATLAIPLYHCGSKAYLNRPIQLQEVDWIKARALLDAVRGQREQGQDKKQIPPG